MARTGNYQRTYTGIAFYPLDPRPEDISLVDVAHHLSLLCRFVGGIRSHYSVAQHSVLCALWLSVTDPTHALWGLLHDASEAYTNDITRPLKHTSRLDEFRLIESEIMAAVTSRFGLPATEPEAVKTTDMRLAISEAAALRVTQRHDIFKSGGLEALPIPIVPWSAEQAETQFLRTYLVLSRAEYSERCYCEQSVPRLGGGETLEATPDCPDCGGTGLNTLRKAWL